ncbi:MAG TPA: Uma2 family endonuclease [Pyrinomonadaceae bacterium]|nr:Uma2 family endonuclease [Pyrinomonadaceae bacterium]
MSVQTSDYLDAVTHLPHGGRLTFYDVGWDDYEQLLAQLDDRAHLRISYNQGRLEIMSPSAKHEKYKNLLHDLVMILSDELEQEVVSFGSATLKIQPRGPGAEGDDCFYIRHTSAIAGRDRLDLMSDPPPDLVVEIDFTHESSGKFAIYAALKVPEIWHYDGGRWQILRLTAQAYELAPFSLAFRMLAAERLAEFVTDSETRGPYQARRAFREWVRATKPGTL